MNMTARPHVSSILLSCPVADAESARVESNWHFFDSKDKEKIVKEGSMVKEMTRKELKKAEGAI